MFTRRIALMLVAAACLPSSLDTVQASDNSQTEQKTTRYYLIGNSLTWDTIPGYLDGDVQWHVACGKSLPYIFGNTLAKWRTCVGRRTPMGLSHG